MTAICMRCYVSGKVQGVWFRAHTKEQAERLNLTGFAKNLADGRVEVVACGEEENVLRLYEWLKKGPALAQVIDVTYEEIEEQAFDGFKTS